MDNFVDEIKEIELHLKKINEMAYFQYKPIVSNLFMQQNCSVE